VLIIYIAIFLTIYAKIVIYVKACKGSTSSKDLNARKIISEAYKAIYTNPVFNEVERADFIEKKERIKG